MRNVSSVPLVLGLVLATAGCGEGVIGGEVGAAGSNGQQRTVNANAASVAVDAQFRAFYQRGGGLATFGYALSPAFSLTGHASIARVQWFERARLELHPDNDEPYRVLAGRLGAALAPASRRAAASKRDGCTFASETHHNVCRPFRRSYQQRFMSLGYPLTEAYVTTLANGRQALVQWFERARLEHAYELEPIAARQRGRVVHYAASHDWEWIFDFHVGEGLNDYNPRQRWGALPNARKDPWGYYCVHPDYVVGQRLWVHNHRTNQGVTCTIADYVRVQDEDAWRHDERNIVIEANIALERAIGVDPNNEAADQGVEVRHVVGDVLIQLGRLGAECHSTRRCELLEAPTEQGDPR